MKHVYRPPMLLLAALLGLSQCQKNSADPADQLPAATQTGRNTFGCLVDGKVWTPNGNNGTSNFRLTYDPGYAGGDLIIRTYRYDDSKRQYLLITGVPIAATGAYRIGINGPGGISYTDEKRVGSCQEYRYTNAGYMSTGTLTVTRLDLGAGIVSGTFDMKVVQTGCDTLRITQGRFDYKL